MRVLPPVEGDLMHASIGRYQRAIQVRTSIDDAAATNEMQAAADALENAYHKVHVEMDARGQGPSLLGSRTKAYAAAGAELIQIADARRAALAAYTIHADRMDQRLTKSLDGALKIFGRVLARQSLMQLHVELDDMRHRFREFSSDDVPQQQAAISASEAVFSSTFSGNTVGFAKSEGDPWLKDMRNDFAALVELRQSIEDFDARARDSADRLENCRLRLVQSVPKSIAASAVEVKASLPLPVLKPPTVKPLVAVAPTPMASPVYDTVTTTTSHSGQPRPSHCRVGHRRGARNSPHSHRC